MRKHSGALSILAAACAVGAVSQVRAAQLIYEPFNSANQQTAGTAITGTNPTTPATGTWLDAGTVGSPAHQIASPGLTSPAGFPAAAGNMGDLKNADYTEFERLNIPNAFNTDLSPKYGAGSTLYYSLLLDVPSIAGLNTPNSNANVNDGNIISFNNSQGAQAARANSWNGELTIRLGSTAGTYNLGVRASTTTANTTYWTGDLNPGDTHLIVVQATLGSAPGTAANDSNSIWLDPSAATFGAAVAPSPSGSSNGAASATAANDSMQSILIGAGIDSTGTSKNPNDVYVDEIRVGDTWADVTAVPTPEPTTIGLLACGALGLAARRRRTA